MKNMVIGGVAVVAVLSGLWMVSSASFMPWNKQPLEDGNGVRPIDTQSQQANIEQAGQVAASSAANATSTKTVSPNEKKITHAVLHTNQGNIEIEFANADAPNTVANFVKLAQSGFYDGVKFHRVIRGFMIQSGDPLSKDDSQQAMWGTGGPGYSFPDELRPNNKNDKGTVAMANTGPNTNGSQFFINVANNNFLDGKHVVFGKVVSGMDVVTKIENTPTGQNDCPVSPMIIKNVTVD